MRIAVNTRLLLKNKLDGIGWFSYESLKRITRSHPEHEFIFLFDRHYSEEFIFSDNIIPVIVPPPARHPLLWSIWFERSVPLYLKKYSPDLFFSPDGYMPLSLEIPSVIVIHDINFHHRPEDLPFSSRRYYKYFFPRFARKASRVLTVSQYSKNDICQTYGIPEDKVAVVYNGVNSAFKPLSEEKIKAVRDKYTSGSPYFIFVGSMHPRKNIARMLEAFDLFREETATDFKMVIVGEKMFMTGEIEGTYKRMKYRDEVVFAGRQDPAELGQLMGAATGLTFVPLFEGFGIPLLEAMNCEIPLLASNVTSLPEIAGEAAIYADPLDISSIKEGMKKLAEDTGLRGESIDKARIIRNHFSWDKTASAVWDNIHRLLPG